MMVNFDYEKYAQQLAEDAEKEIPEDIDYGFKKVISIHVYTGCRIVLEALIEEYGTKYSIEDVFSIVDSIKNWIVQKNLELSKEDIDDFTENKIDQCILLTINAINISIIAKEYSKAELIRVINQHIAKSNIKIDKMLAKSKNKNGILKKILNIFYSIKTLFFGK